MIEIREALDHWRRRVQGSPVDQYPIIWASHYSGPSILGEFGLPALPDTDNAAGKTIHASLFPFALSPAVQCSYVVADEEAVFGVRKRRLVVGRLLALSSGVLNSYWHCRFGVSDRGVVHVGVPVQEMPTHREVWDTLGSIMDQRLALGESVSFDEAWLASSERFKELMT